MSWLLENFQIVLVVVLAFVSWLKHRADLKNAEQEEREAKETMAEEPEMWEPPPVLERRPPPLEPAPVRPPPLSRPPVQVPPAARSQAAAQEAEGILQQQLDLQERLRKIKETKTLTTGGAVATQLRVKAPQRKSNPADSGDGLSKSLRNPKELRRAIVLREILGPPVGLR